jgi:ATP-dependent DNA helicase RecG
MEIRGLSNAEVLERAGLARSDDVTLAALILLGSEAALDRHVAHHEVVYEYRDRPGEVHARVRRNLRRAFMLSFDELWGLVDARNSIIEVPTGMLRKSIPAFNEAAVREGIMNAVTHRDYQRPESVFVRHDPDRLAIESPGGFPPNVTVENVLDRQVPRNRLIAESLERVGLVERSGQGADIMFREAVREAKPLPSFDGTDAERVVLTLFSTIRDPELVRAFDAITRDKLDVVHVRDFLVIDVVAQGKSVPASLVDRVPKLIELGVLERQGRRRLILSQKLHSAAGRRGAYTRAVGLDRSAQMELAYKHLQLAGRQGAPMREVMEVFPGLDRHRVFALLDALRKAGRARVEGERRAARWLADDA